MEKLFEVIIPNQMLMGNVLPWKVHKKLSSNPSQLARPNVICIFQMKRQRLHVREKYGRYIRAVITLNDFEVSAVID